MDLPSWRDSGSRRAVVEFVESVTRPGAAFVPPADRIAAFDNDGTLWVEQPAPPQFDFLLRVWSQEARENPSLAERQPYKAIVERDPAFFEGLVTQDPDAVSSLESAAARSWAGTTPDVFEAQVRRWAETVKQPRFGVAYTDLVYRPMLELFDYLKAHDFRVFVCSGGGRDFMRVFAEEIWGLPKENVIGTAPAYEYTDGRIVRTDRMLGGLALGAGKPEHIYAHTGRLPLFAAGNADVDIEMLTTASFALLISHDDAEREYAYTKAADTSLAKAEKLGWVVVSMKGDWSAVFSSMYDEWSLHGCHESIADSSRSPAARDRSETSGGGGGPPGVARADGDRVVVGAHACDSSGAGRVMPSSDRARATALPGCR
ncbi:HAD family hydrolase [Kitasatospora sp. NPDC058218]|uniref:HAD family hydrolase n=1 Tax=Kitasatospora sp. NPDC058218 TaxID=3346385 RepID=UPI0036D97604